jgi:uncharacterized protein (TIGR02118 family)
MIKMVNVYRKPGMTREAFDVRWLVQHGDLVRKHAKAMGFLRYVQNHNLPSPEIAAFAASRGWDQPSDGVTEVWWESLQSMQAAMATAEGQRASKEFQEDEEQTVVMPPPAQRLILPRAEGCSGSADVVQAKARSR